MEHIMPFDNLPTPYADLMTKHGFIPSNHASLNFEKVEVRDLFDDKGDKLEGWQRVVNVDRNATIHVVTDQYKLVPNEVCYAAFEDALHRSNLDLTGMHIGTDMTHGGGRTFRQYLLPAHNVPVKPGVDVALRIIMLNSYDGTLAFRGLAGAFNFVCANTSILGNKAADFTIRHVGKIDIDAAARQLVAAAEGFVQETEGWKVWPSIRVTDTQAIDVFKAIPAVNESTLEHLSLQWLRARDGDSAQSGPNVWTLYNVLTAWATHTASRSNGAAARFQRDGAVRKVIDGKVWKELVAA
jgi:hypothetical protein